VVEFSSTDAHQEEANFQWVLSVDGSSNQQGSGAGVILKGPNGLLRAGPTVRLQGQQQLSGVQSPHCKHDVGKRDGSAESVGKERLPISHRSGEWGIPGQGPSDGYLPRVCPDSEGVIRGGACPQRAECLS